MASASAAAMRRVRLCARPLAVRGATHGLLTCGSSRFSSGSATRGGGGGHDGHAAISDTTLSRGGRDGRDGRGFLIKNTSNSVYLMQCPTAEAVSKGIRETADLPHIVVAGESNAGKSSLLNHLLKKSLAKVRR